MNIELEYREIEYLLDLLFEERYKMKNVKDSIYPTSLTYVNKTINNIDKLMEKLGELEDGNTNNR